MKSQFQVHGLLIIQLAQHVINTTTTTVCVRKKGGPHTIKGTPGVTSRPYAHSFAILGKDYYHIPYSN